MQSNIEQKRKIMEKIVLKKDIVDQVKSDATLYGIVASKLGISPSSLPRLLYNNSAKLIQVDVLNSITAHLGLKDNTELLEMQ